MLENKRRLFTLPKDRNKLTDPVNGCRYDSVQSHVCNNASVCTSVSQHELIYYA